MKKKIKDLTSLEALNICWQQSVDDEDGSRRCDICPLEKICCLRTDIMYAVKAFLDGTLAKSVEEEVDVPDATHNPDDDLPF
jgi:hypothetical protein